MGLMCLRASEEAGEQQERGQKEQGGVKAAHEGPQAMVGCWGAVFEEPSGMT